MDNPVVNLIKILTDNNIFPKYREIPDEFDLKDELLSEIEMEMEGNLPDSMRYFEINGFSSPVDLGKFIKHGFAAFKISIMSNPISNQDILFREIHDQITEAKADLINKEQSLQTLNDITLNALIKLKIQACDNVLELLAVEPDKKGEQVPPTNHGKKNIYVFRINKSFDSTCDYMLLKMHKELKKAGYINCSLREFKRLFIRFGDRKPDQTPHPVIWNDKEYNHFAYFIKCINRVFLSYSRLPSNTEIAIHVFYKLFEGNYFKPSKVRFDSKLDPDVKKQFDAIMRHIGLNKKTTLL